MKATERLRTILSPSPGAGHQRLIWMSLLVTVLICAALTTLHFRQKGVMQNHVDVLENLRQARLDLAAGLLHIALSKDASAPFDRDQGAALLQQALHSLAYTADRLSAVTNLPSQAFRDKIRNFQLALAAWRSTALPTPAQEASLRITVAELESQADVLDRLAIDKMKIASGAMEREYLIAVLASGLMLGGVCLAIFRLGAAKARADAALAESEARWSFALEGAGDGVFDWDIPAGRVFYSRQWKSILDCEENEIGTGLEEWSERLHPDDRQGALEAVHSHLRGDCVTMSQEFRMRANDGSYRWIMARGRVISRDAEGLPLRMIGTHTDISRLKEVEAHLARARQQAEDASAAKSEFLANMSHELRTPINGLTGMLNLLQLSNLDAEQSDYVGQAMQACRRISGLIGDVLDITRVEAGQLPLIREPFEIAKVMEAVEGGVRPQIGDKKLDLLINQDPAIPGILVGDAYRLRQILLNLAGNAVRLATAGAVSIEISPVTQNDGLYWIVFAVAGPGTEFTEALAEDVFEPFSTPHPGYRKQEQGVGLSLAISSRLARVMGGELTVSNSVGKGAVFIARLPFALPRSQASREERPPETGPSPVRRILVVEDEAINRMALQGLLRSTGWRAEGASNGLEALAMLKQYEFDCVIMDIQMPKMDGLEATGLIRASTDLKSRRDIPIIALTAHALAGDKDKFLAQGMTGYVAKPFEFGELQALAERLVSERSGD